MKVSEDSDSLPTDPEDDGVFIGVGFREAFHPHRDCKIRQCTNNTNIQPV